MASINWKNVDSDVRRMARELVEDPEYQEALRRRLVDRKAPTMMRLLLQWPDQKARDPQELWRGKPPLTVVFKHPLGYDPLAEQTRLMIEKQTARERQEQREKQTAAASPPPEDPPDPDTPELVRGI